MRLIGPLQGFAAFTEKEEEYQPETGTVQSDLIPFIANRYNFQSFPVLSPGTMPQPVLPFAGGKFVGEGQPFAIGQLLMTQNADVVVTVTTEQAELVLLDLVKALDENFGFRLGEASKRQLLLSNVVVEFDKGLEEYIGKLSQISDIINNLGAEMPAFNIKRLAFGAGDILVPANDPVAVMQHADFLIERRQGSPYEANRYFCSAPMHTRDLIRALERIETIFS